MKSTGRFYINILTEDQVELCKRFSGGPQPDRFSDLKYDVTESGLPMLLDCAAWLEAEIENEYEAGDHWIVIGRVTSIRNGRDAMPLVFAHGKLHGISALHSWKTNAKNQFLKDTDMLNIAKKYAISQLPTDAELTGCWKTPISVETFLRYKIDAFRLIY